jgi:hypothetical protein
LAAPQDDPTVELPFGCNCETGSLENTWFNPTSPNDSNNISFPINDELNEEHISEEVSKGKNFCGVSNIDGVASSRSSDEDCLNIGDMVNSVDRLQINDKNQSKQCLIGHLATEVQNLPLKFKKNKVIDNEDEVIRRTRKNNQISKLNLI